MHLPGPRQSSTSVLGPAARGMPELIALQRWIPDIADRDVFLCGPSTWTDGFERLRSGRRRSEKTGSTPKALAGEPMRRIVIWLASTVTVVVLLFGYHTSTNKTTSGTTEGGTSGSTTSAGNESSASPSSPSSGSSGSRSTKITTYTGSVAQTRWGPVQVKISVQGGKLTKVTILQQPER